MKIPFFMLAAVVCNLSFASAPYWTQDPIVGDDAQSKAKYSYELAIYIADDDLDGLICSKVSGPAWLNVSGDCTASGTPDASDMGLNTFTVRVSDATQSDDATYEVTVK